MPTDPYANVAQTIANRQQQYYATNPWLQGGLSMQPYQTQPGDDPTKGAIAAVSQAILRGAMIGYGSNQAQSQFNTYLQGSPELSRDLAPYQIQGALQTGMDAGTTYRNELAKQSAQQAYDPRSVFMRANGLGDPGLPSFGSGPTAVQPGVVSPTGAPAPTVGGAPGSLPTQPVAAQPDAAPVVGNNPTGGVLAPRINNRLNEIAQRVVTGMTPAQAYETTANEQKTAFDQNLALQQQSRQDAELLDAEKVQAERKKFIGETTLKYVKDAGTTGGFFETPRDWGAGILAAAGNEDQQKKLNAQELLDQVFVEVKKLNRSPGEGAQSDKDLEVLQASSPGSWHPAAVNMALGERYLADGTKELERNQFKRAWLSSRGTLQGADDAWNAQQAQKNALPTMGQVQPPTGGSGGPTGSGVSNGGSHGSADPGVMAMVDAAATKYGVPLDLARRVASQESNFDQSAVSNKGAQGVMQLMPATAADLGVDPTNLEQNIDGGMRYLAQQLKTFNGDPQLAAAAYNAGPGNVRKYGGVPPFKETQNYVQSVAGAQQNGLPPAKQPIPQAPKAPSEPNAGKVAAQNAMGLIHQMGQGASFGFADEAAAGLRSGISGVQRYFGMKPSFADYDAELAALRSEKNQFQSQHPYASVAAQLIGGAPSAIALPLGRAKEGATILSNAGRLALGGAAYGGVAGAGAGGEPGGLSRFDSATLGAGIGAVASPAFSGAAGALSAAAKTTPVRNVVQSILRPGALRPAVSEAGAIFPTGATKEAQLATLTPAELGTLKLTHGVTAEQLDKALAAAADAEARGGQLLLPEAVDSPALYLQAKKLSNKPNTMNIAQEPVKERAALAPDRVLSTFRKLGSDVTPQEGGTSARQAALDIIARAKEERTKAVSPLFQKAYSEVPQLHSDRMDELLQNPIIKRTVNKAKESVGMENMPANSTQVVQETLETLGGQIEALRASKLKPPSKITLRRLVGAKDALEREAKSLNPALGVARERFKELSPAVNKLENSQMSVISRMSDDDLGGAADDVFRLEPERIEELRQTFAQDGKLYAWDEMIRGHIKRAVNSTQDGMNKTMLRGLVGSRASRAKLRAAVGSDLYNEVEPMLSLEQKYVEGAQNYFAGSPTDPLKEAGEATNAWIRMFKALSSKTGAASEGAKFLLMGKPNDELEREIARIVFDPKRGKDFLEKAAPYVRAIEEYQRKVQAAAQAGGRVGSRELTGAQITDRSKK